MSITSDHITTLNDTKDDIDRLLMTALALITDSGGCISNTVIIDRQSINTAARLIKISRERLADI